MHAQAVVLSRGLERLGFKGRHARFFDTLTVDVGAGKASVLLTKAKEAGFNLRRHDAATVGISVDETTRTEDVDAVERYIRALERGTEVARAELETLTKGNVERQKAVDLARARQIAARADPGEHLAAGVVEDDDGTVLDVPAG